MKNLIITLGRYDDPQTQSQKDFEFDLLKSNLAVFGTSMSGKTTLLKTFLLRMHQELKLTAGEEIYILDFGSGLKAYYDLPYVAGYFNASHEENIRRVFKILEEKLQKNGKKLEGGTYAEAPADRQPNHITFLLDGFSSFISEDRFFPYHESLKKLAREGLSKGLTVVITAAETSGFSRLLPSFKTVVALDLPKDRYADLYTGKVEKPMVLPGRGIINEEANLYEFQAFLPWNVRDPKYKDQKEAEERMIRRIGRWIAHYGMQYDTAILDDENIGEYFRTLEQDPRNAERWQANLKIIKEYNGRRLENLPEKLTADNWKVYCRTPFLSNDGLFVAGLDYYTLEPVPGVARGSLNLTEAQTIAIYGRKEFGKSNLLKLLLEAADRLPDTHFYFWDDGREALTKPEGLFHTIECLQHKKFLKSREDFLNTLDKIKFWGDAPETEEDLPDNYDTDSGFNPEYDEILEEKRAEFLRNLDMWDENWHQDFKEEVQRRIDIGEYTKEWADKEKAAHDTEYSNRLKAFEDVQEHVIRNVVAPPSGKTEEIPEDTGDFLRVFVVQSRLFYQNPPEGEQNHMILKLASAMGSSREKILFIFSDVQRIESTEVQTYFNNSIRYAFLLDDIVRFINSKGQRSVFGNQDISDLKERFGPCEVGDGYFFDIDRDELTKLKFLHAAPHGAE